jgi:hypothetical protein
VTCMVLSLLTIESRKFGFIIILKTTQWLTSQLEMYKLFVRTYIHLSCAVVNCEPDTCSFFNVAPTRHLKNIYYFHTYRTSLKVFPSVLGTQYINIP